MPAHQHRPLRLPSVSRAFSPRAVLISTVIYLGINDCGRTPSDELQSILETLFDAVHDLYVKAKARNFVFINVPPIDRSPGGMGCILSSSCISDITHTFDQGTNTQTISRCVLQSGTRLLRSEPLHSPTRAHKQLFFSFRLTQSSLRSWMIPWITISLTTMSRLKVVLYGRTSCI
jgi:hypothetical protein